jgi:hypothetical protein
MLGHAVVPTHKVTLPDEPQPVPDAPLGIVPVSTVGMLEAAASPASLVEVGSTHPLSIDAVDKSVPPIVPAPTRSASATARRRRGAPAGKVLDFMGVTLQQIRGACKLSWRRGTQKSVERECESKA